MFRRGFLLTLVGALALVVASSTASIALGPVAVPPGESVAPRLVLKADTYKTCQQIHWCGARRDGTPYCGPTLRCRTCKFVRKCTRALGCVWEEKCRWGPYQPVIQQQ